MRSKKCEVIAAAVPVCRPSHLVTCAGRSSREKTRLVSGETSWDPPRDPVRETKIYHSERHGNHSGCREKVS